MIPLLHHVVRFPIAALLVACAASCSSDCPEPPDCTGADAGQEAEAGDSGQPDAPVEAIAAFCDATLGRSPKVYQTCCTEQEKASGTYRALEGTAAALAWECTSKLTRSAMLGRIGLQSEAASGCMQAVAEAYDGAGCGILVLSFDWEASACREVVQGRQELGQPCRYRYECADGLTCDGYNDGVDGTCAQPPEAFTCLVLEYSGAADDVVDSLFGHHPACAPGWSCAHTDQYGQCSKTVGEGQHCIAQSDCDAGLTCRVGVCGTLPPGAQGAPCITAGDCVAGMFCEVAGGNQGTCAPRKAAGDACSPPGGAACRGACVSIDGGAQGVCVEFCGSG
ncbi:MAG: hypothetical protein HY898_22660 [Deltaproteobacteria bacterium]|nr:hypothetical protein [Deltaproteobacteria bacterium]